ncbi:MAG: PH domain-containing protein [Gordonia sp. (in: high G+C Gram-positive bacteria)]|uniref:PH domain-containing protein n=1 Tax=Gordonia sp. (in: high G+C Gram-positive bacteria) TaxID=84139 RepID=UPI003BB6BB51
MSVPAATRPSQAPESVAFVISRLAYLTVVVTLVIAVMLLGVSLWFGWVLLLPFAQIWWIRRIKTVIDDDGLTAVHTVGQTRVEWSELAGLQFPKWSAVRAVRLDGDRVALPAVSFDDLPVLSLYSGGRVPDPFAAEREARQAERAANA